MPTQAGCPTGPSHAHPSASDITSRDAGGLLCAAVLVIPSCLVRSVATNRRGEHARHRWVEVERLEPKALEAGFRQPGQAHRPVDLRRGRHRAAGIGSGHRSLEPQDRHRTDAQLAGATLVRRRSAYSFVDPPSTIVDTRVPRRKTRLRPWTPLGRMVAWTASRTSAGCTASGA